MDGMKKEACEEWFSHFKILFEHDGVVLRCEIDPDQPLLRTSVRLKYHIPQ